MWVLYTTCHKIGAHHSSLAYLGSNTRPRSRTRFSLLLFAPVIFVSSHHQHIISTPLQLAERSPLTRRARPRLLTNNMKNAKRRPLTKRPTPTRRTTTQSNVIKAWQWHQQVAVSKKTNQVSRQFCAGKPSFRTSATRPALFHSVEKCNQPPRPPHAPHGKADTWGWGHQHDAPLPPFSQKLVP